MFRRDLRAVRERRRRQRHRRTRWRAARRLLTASGWRLSRCQSGQSDRERRQSNQSESSHVSPPASRAYIESGPEDRPARRAHRPGDNHPFLGEPMKYRMLADTGVFVSELCLGAMTFGGRGQMWEVIGGLDQAAVDAIVHRSLDAGVNFIDTADVYSAGESETMVGKALAGPAPAGRAGDQGPRPDGEGAERSRVVAAPHPRGDRCQPEAPRHRLHRPVPDPPVRFADQRRGHAACARRRGARGEGALHRLFEPCRVADDEGAGHLESRRPRAVPVHAVLLLAGRARARARDRSAPQGPEPGAARLESAGRRVPLGQVHARRRRRHRTARIVRLPAARQGARLSDHRVDAGHRRARTA